ncbi:MAG: Ig-like domain-containing protein, partial [Gallionella sp.]|nr:Ig-like domain-containing protein [Gallionella sp.]
MASAQTLALQTGKTTQPIKAGQSNAIKVQAGEQYRIVKGKKGEEQLLDDVIAKRQGNDLLLQYADGTQVTLENFYVECKSAAICGVTLPGQEAGGYVISGESATGVTLDDKATLVYAHGNHDVLMGMAQGNGALHTTLAGLSGAEVTYIPSGSPGIWTPGNLGMLGAGLGVAIVAGGGGGGGGGGGAAPPPDLTPPTVTITDNEAGTGNIAGGDITYTFTFSEAVTGFAAGDIVVTGGTKGVFTAVSGTVYTLVVTPAPGFEGNITVDVAAGVATDAGGNGNTAAMQSTQMVDTLAPTLTITSDVGTVRAGETATITFTFSEDPGASFTNADIVTTGGTLGVLSGTGL